MGGGREKQDEYLVRVDQDIVEQEEERLFYKARSDFDQLTLLHKPPGGRHDLYWPRAESHQ
jgi:hypothetical protein